MLHTKMINNLQEKNKIFIKIQTLYVTLKIIFFTNNNNNNSNNEQNCIFN